MEPHVQKTWAFVRRYLELEKWVSDLPEYRKKYPQWKDRLLEQESIPFERGTFREFFRQHYRDSGLSSVSVLNYDLSPIRQRQLKRTFNVKRLQKFNLTKPTLPQFPAKLKVEIDCRKNLDDILNDIKNLLNLLRDEYEIPQNRNRPDDEVEFKVLTLNEIGLKPSSIKDCLMKQYKNRNPDQRDSYRKKINRVLKKIKTTA